MDPIEEKKIKTLNTVQTLITVAFIAGPVSLLIGGVVLGTVALVCGIVALVKAHSVVGPEDGPGTVARSLYVQSIVAVGISAVCLTLNLITFVFAFGALLQAMQSGDLSSLLNPIAQTSPDVSSSSGKSIWD